MPYTTQKVRWETDEEGRRWKVTSKDTQQTKTDRLMQFSDFFTNAANTYSTLRSNRRQQIEFENAQYDRQRQQAVFQEVSNGVSNELQRIMSDYHGKNYGNAYVGFSYLDSMMKTNTALRTAVMNDPNLTKYYTDVTDILGKDLILDLPTASTGEPRNYRIAGGITSLMNSKSNPERTEDFRQLFMNGTPSTMQDPIMMASGFDPADWRGPDGNLVSSEDYQKNATVSKIAMTTGKTKEEVRRNLDYNEKLAKAQEVDLDENIRYGFGANTTTMRNIKGKVTSMIFNLMHDDLSYNENKNGPRIEKLGPDDQNAMIDATMKIAIKQNGGTVPDAEYDSAVKIMRGYEEKQNLKYLRSLYGKADFPLEEAFIQANVRQQATGEFTPDSEILAKVPEEERYIAGLYRDLVTLKTDAMQTQINPPTMEMLIPANKIAEGESDKPVDVFGGIKTLLLGKKENIQKEITDGTDLFRGKILRAQLSNLDAAISGVTSAESINIMDRFSAGWSSEAVRMEREAGLGFAVKHSPHEIEMKKMTQEIQKTFASSKSYEEFQNSASMKKFKRFLADNYDIQPSTITNETLRKKTIDEKLALINAKVAQIKQVDPTGRYAKMLDPSFAQPLAEYSPYVQGVIKEQNRLISLQQLQAQKDKAAAELEAQKEAGKEKRILMRTANPVTGYNFGMPDSAGIPAQPVDLGATTGDPRNKWGLPEDRNSVGVGEEYFNVQLGQRAIRKQ